MTQRFNLEIAKVSKVIIEEMFQVQSGEVIALTADSGTDSKVVDALAAATYAAGGIPLVMWTPTARGDGEVGMPDWPAKALTAALCEVDVWIELQSVIMLYSHIWETAMAKNQKLRYLIIGNMAIDSMVRVFTGYDIQVLGEFLERVRDMILVTQKVHITSPNGTDVSYEINLDYAFDFDNGDFSKPTFGTAPGYVNVVPKLGSMNGKIVFDNLMNAKLLNTENQVGFTMKNGQIEEVFGNKEAENFKAYLAAFNDPNMYKISHNMLGFNPCVHRLNGDIVEDERIWGGVDFGFGHTSPLDMPPNGQPAKSHFDGIVAKTSIFFDDTQIVDNGTVCHPKLKDLANQLLG